MRCHPKPNNCRQFLHPPHEKRPRRCVSISQAQQQDHHPAAISPDTIYARCHSVNRQQHEKKRNQNERIRKTKSIIIFCLLFAFCMTQIELLTSLSKLSGNLGSLSLFDKRTASRVLATYVGTEWLLLLTFCILGSPFSIKSCPMYKFNASALPFSAKYNRKLSAPTADEMQFDNSQSTCALVGCNCNECVKSNSIWRLSACTQNFHLKLHLLSVFLFGFARKENKIRRRWPETETKRRMRHDDDCHKIKRKTERKKENMEKKERKERKRKTKKQLSIVQSIK